MEEASSEVSVEVGASICRHVAQRTPSFLNRAGHKTGFRRPSPLPFSLGSVRQRPVLLRERRWRQGGRARRRRRPRGTIEVARAARTVHNGEHGLPNLLDVIARGDRIMGRNRGRQCWLPACKETTRTRWTSSVGHFKAATKGSSVGFFSFLFVHYSFCSCC